MNTVYKHHRDRMTNPNFPKGNMGDWQSRHLRAVQSPKDAEGPIVRLIFSWLEYADRHAERFEDGIGNDYVLGADWVKIGMAMRGLLNGECGRLDCGTLDGVILGAMDAEGFDENGDTKGGA